MSDQHASLRVQIAVRSAMLAKTVLEMVGMEPTLVRLQLNEVVQQIHELELALKDGLAREGSVRR